MTMTAQLTTTTLSPLDDRWLTAKEAAHYLAVKVEMLSKWRLRGMGPRYSAALGRDPRYRLSDLVDYMTTKMAANTREARTFRRERVSVDGARYTMRRRGHQASRRS